MRTDWWHVEIETKRRAVRYAYLGVGVLWTRQGGGAICTRRIRRGTRKVVSKHSQAQPLSTLEQLERDLST